MNRLKDLSIAALLAGSALAATSGAVFASETGGEGSEGGKPGTKPEMTVEAITARLRESGAERILEIEQEHEDGRPVYEVKYVDADSRTREVYLDGDNGRRLESESEDDED